MSDPVIDREAPAKSEMITVVDNRSASLSSQDRPVTGLSGHRPLVESGALSHTREGEVAVYVTMKQRQVSIRQLNPFRALQL